MTTVTSTASTTSLLTDEMLERFHQRAPVYDRENRFFDEDFEELRAAGYLTVAVPQDFGGGGLTLAQVAQQQRRLAYSAPATALAVNMHLYWTGVAADLRRFGDPALEWLLREAAAGEVFAAGHGETGNDLPAILVAQGLTNRDIAEKLVVSERTAENHVQRVLNRLGLRSRTQVAAWAVRNGLTG